VLDRVGPDPERDGVDREAEMIEFATKLHAILTPEQRAELADKIAAGGPMLFGRHHGPKGKHGQHGGKGDERGPAGEGKHDPAERLARAVDRLCAPISCTAEQETQLTATFTGMHEAKREARAELEQGEPDFAPLAAAFGADTLDQAQLRAALAGGKVHMGERKAAHGEQLGVALAEIHDILTPEQRGIVADQIAAEGLRAVLGKGDGHHGKRGHGKRCGAARRTRC
jgi:Spy/CpxP family protein refolding chaperone